MHDSITHTALTGVGDEDGDELSGREEGDRARTVAGEEGGVEERALEDEVT